MDNFSTFPVSYSTCKPALLFEEYNYRETAFSYALMITMKYT